MFRLDLTPTFSAQVAFDLPTATPGTRQQAVFTGTFPRLSQDELEALGAEIAAGKLTDRQVAQRLLRGWGDDLADSRGNPLPYGPDTLAQVLNVAGLASAVVHAFRAAQPKAALGN